MRSSAFGSWRMTLHVALHHRTTYHYDRLVALGPQILRLRPAPYGKTPILSYSLAVEPKRHFINWQQDPHANYQARLVFPERTRELIITVDLVADLAVTNPFDFFLEPAAETFPFRYDPDLAAELAPYCEVEPAGPRLRQWLAGVDRCALRLGVSHPAEARRQAADRTRRAGERLHRSPCLGRGLSAGRRLGRARSHFGAVCRRRAHPA